MSLLTKSYGTSRKEITVEKVPNSIIYSPGAFSPFCLLLPRSEVRLHKGLRVFLSHLTTVEPTFHVTPEYNIRALIKVQQRPCIYFDWNTTKPNSQ